MVRDVYRVERQFYFVSELQTSLLQSWDNIISQLRQTLVSSMRKRCSEVLQRFVARTSY